MLFKRSIAFSVPYKKRKALKKRWDIILCNNWIGNARQFIQRCSCLVGSKKGKERTRYRNRPTFECDVWIYRSCVKLAEDHIAPGLDLLWVKCTSASTKERNASRCGVLVRASSTARALLNLWIAKHRRVRRLKRGAGSFICMPRNPVRNQFCSRGV